MNYKKFKTTIIKKYKDYMITLVKWKLRIMKKYKDYIS